jgi:hypothetical protein
VGGVSDVAHDRLRSAVVGELALKLANQVIEAGAARGIVFMPLKGVLLLARWPALRGRRAVVDIDLLVRSSDEAVAVRVLRELGFEATVGSSAGVAFVNEAWPLSIDMHRELFPHGLFRASADGLFTRAEHDVIRLEDAARLGGHLRALGLQRAAGYVLGDASFRGEPIARATIRALELCLADRAAIAGARLDTRWNRDTPRWWTPHLLDRSLVAGSGSLLRHAEEGVRRHLGRHAMGWR